MSALEEVIAHGNRGHSGYPDSTIVCADGFSLSVIAGGGTYCTPRPAFCSCASRPGSRPMPAYSGELEHDFPGPYLAVEVGFPSERPEPWDAWAQYADEYVEIFPFVPVQLVRDLVAAHGGEQS